MYQDNLGYIFGKILRVENTKESCAHQDFKILFVELLSEFLAPLCALQQGTNFHIGVKR